MLKAKTSRRDTSVKAQALAEAVKDDTTRINAEIPVSLHKKIKIRAVQEGTSITDLMIKAFNEYLSK